MRFEPQSVKLNFRNSNVSTVHLSQMATKKTTLKHYKRIIFYLAQWFCGRILMMTLGPLCERNISIAANKTPPNISIAFICITINKSLVSLNYCHSPTNTQMDFISPGENTIMNPLYCELLCDTLNHSL